jgi:hypothetical protein
MSMCKNKIEWTPWFSKSALGISRSQD